jgi:hypothetical protein
MFKQFLLLTSFVLVLSLAADSPALDLVWDNDSGGGDRLWDSAANWVGDKVPTDSDAVLIDGSFTEDGHGPIIDSNTSAVCRWLSGGRETSPTTEAVLTMTGGTLAVSSWMAFGDEQPGDYRFDFTGGVLTLPGNFYIGNQAGTNATLNISEGAAIIGGGNFYLGYDFTSVGTVNMTGGTIAIEGYFDLSEQGSTWSTFNMHGGEISMDRDLYMAWEADVCSIFTMDDGHLSIGEDLEIAQYDQAEGAFNMHGGEIELGDDIWVGWAQTSPALFNMTGGTVTCTSEWGPLNGEPDDKSWLHLSADSGSGGGHLNMHGGTLSTYNIAISKYGSMSITEGTLILDEDVTGANGWLWDPIADSNENGTLMGLASQVAGPITMYGTYHGGIIDDANYPTELGKRAALKVDYNARTPGKTTVTADVTDAGLAWYEKPFSGSMWQPSAITLSWSPGDGADSHDVYFGTNYSDVDNGTGGTSQGNQDINSYSPGGALTLEQTYYWRIDEVIGETTLKGAVWNFTVAPGAAVNPSPADEASGISPLEILSWTPGIEADTHELYFSIDFDEVNERSVPKVYPVTNSYDPGALELNTTYYWAVDEVNLAADVTLWPGDVWQFTTATHLAVDNFESYANNTALNGVWDDYVDNDSGAEIYLETDTAYDDKSLEFFYDNAYRLSGNLYGSWTNADIVDLQIGPDWTLGGAKALRLVFYGDPDNSTTVNDKMYIALDGVTVESSYYPDVNDISKAKWQEWAINLEDFNGVVDLESVSTISIGFGTYGGSITSGGEGIVYFDDIEVWAPYCRSEHFPADIDGDCIADIADLKIMSADWLIQDYNFIASDPPEANLIGWWKLDEGTGTGLIAEDSSMYDNDGNIVDASWTTGHTGEAGDFALALDGDGVMQLDSVICAYRDGNDPGIYPAELMPSDAFTIAGWVNLNSFDNWAAIVCNVEDTYEDDCGFALHCYSGNIFGFLIVTKTMGESEYIFTPEDEPYDTHTWYHVAGVYDGNDATIYVDAAVAAGPTYVGGPMNWQSFDLGWYPERFIIGAYFDRNESYYLDGVIDEVRYYNYALSEDELAIIAELGTPGEDIYQPVPSPANIADPEPELSRKVNLVDYAVLADSWLTEQLWP